MSPIDRINSILVTPIRTSTPDGERNAAMLFAKTAQERLGKTVSLYYFGRFADWRLGRHASSRAP